MTIPTEIAEILKVKDGEEIEFVSSNGDIIIRKPKKV